MDLNFSLLAFVDHRTDRTGEPVAALLRPGSAGSNTAAHHIEITRKALAQLCSAVVPRRVRTVIVRTDGAGASHTFMTWLHNKPVSYAPASGRCPPDRVRIHRRRGHRAEGGHRKCLVGRSRRLGAGP
ncbi:transposase [Rhodococcus erythropolis]|nr:transposase [Rhodococcus erythropolis]